MKDHVGEYRTRIEAYRALGTLKRDVVYGWPGVPAGQQHVIVRKSPESPRTIWVRRPLALVPGVFITTVVQVEDVEFACSGIDEFGTAYYTPTGSVR